MVAGIVLFAMSDNEFQDCIDEAPSWDGVEGEVQLSASLEEGGAPEFPGSEWTPTNPFHPDYDPEAVAEEALQAEGVDPQALTIRDLLQLGWVRIKHGQRAVATHSGALAVGAALGAAVASAAWSSHCTSESSSVISDALHTGHAVYQLAQGHYSGAASSVLRVGPQSSPSDGDWQPDLDDLGEEESAGADQYPDLYPD